MGSGGGKKKNTVTTNILLEPCMDFLALGSNRLTSAAKTQSAYAAVLLEESLARSISRSLSSSFQSIVVYRVSNGSSDGQISIPSASDALEGLISSHGLVLGMHAAGLFQSLRFDPAKPLRRRPSSSAVDDGAKLTFSAQRSATSSDIRARVRFNSTIELDFLTVPTCPEHGVSFLRFKRDGDKDSTMDFRSLKDAADPKMSGAIAQCLACQKTLGKVVMLQQLAVQQAVAQDGAGKLASGFFSGDALSYVADAVMPRSSSSSDGVPTSVLKPGTSVPTSPTAAKKTRARGQTLRTATDEETTSTRVDDCHVTLFGGICCASPCQAPESRIHVAPTAESKGYSR